MSKQNVVVFPFPNPAKAIALLLIIAGVIALDAPVAEAAWLFDVSAGMRYTDNETNAASAGGKKGNIVSSANMSAGGYMQVADYTGVSLTLDVVKEVNSDYEGLSLLSTGLSLKITHKLGLGPAAIRLNLYGSVSNDDYSDRFRDSVSYKTGIFGSRWVDADERVKLGLGYEFDRRTASTSGYGGTSYGSYVSQYAQTEAAEYTNIYDLQGHSGIINAEISFTERDTLLVSYRYRSGDVVSVDMPTQKALDESSAYSHDAVFKGLTAYRIPATTHIGTVEISRALIRKMSLNLGYSLNITSAKGGNDYQVNTFNAIVAYSF